MTYFLLFIYYLDSSIIYRFFYSNQKKYYNSQTTSELMQEVPQSPQNIVNFRPQSFSSTKHQTQNINNCSFAYFQQQASEFQNSGSEQQINHEKAPLFQLLQQQSSIGNSIGSSNVCSECNKKFLKQAHLIRHINERHQNTRLFICKEPNCGKSFKRDSHLRRHMISHTHQKSYKCQQCIMAFGYKHHLDRHVKAVHEKQLLRCQSCSLSFVKKKAFIKHLQKIHLSEKTQKLDEQNIETQLIKTSKCQKTKKIKKQQAKFKKILEKVDEEKSNQEQDRLFKSFEIESLEGSNKNEVMKQELTSKKQQKNSQQFLFRCIYGDCVSAFSKMHELNRHLKQRHS